MLKNKKMFLSIMSVVSAICIVFTSLTGTAFADNTEQVFVENVNCSVTPNDDGTLKVTSTAPGSVTFNSTFNFTANGEARTFPGTNYIMPQDMIMLSIDKPGDITGYVALRWEGNGNYGWYMIRDNGSTDGVTTLLNVAFYYGSGEMHTTFIPYTYGNKIFAFVHYFPDVNRWRMAVEETGGLYSFYDKDWHAMNPGIDSTPRRAIVNFEREGYTINIKKASPADVVDVDPESITATNVTNTKNDDGTFTLTADKEKSYANFNRALSFLDNNLKYVFNGTEQIVPENAFELSVAAKGDLKGKVGVGAIGANPSMQLIFKDKQSGDETATKLTASYFDDNVEHGEFEFDYTYGKRIFAWMTYGENSTIGNRWSFAVEQSDGTYKVYLTDFYAYTLNAGDYKTAKLFRLTFFNEGDKVIAAARTGEKIPSVKPKEKFNVMNSKEENGAISLWHDTESVYTFTDYVHFKKTGINFTANDTTIAENNLCLTLKPDSIPAGQILGLRLLSEEDIESAKIAPYTLNIEIAADNGDGTGKLGFSVYHPTVPKADFVVQDYKWGDPIYIFPNYNTDINRWCVAIPNTNGVSYTVVGRGLWHSDDVGINPGVANVPYQVSIIAFAGVKNLTAAMVKAEDVLQNETPPIPTDTAFVGGSFTESVDENGNYKLEMQSANYAKSTFTTDLTKGLIFRLSNFSNDWVSLNVADSFWKIGNNSLGDTAGEQFTLLLRNQGGSLYVAIFQNGMEIVPNTHIGIPALGTHILSVKSENGGQYYKLTIDGEVVVPALSIMSESFDKINNYDANTGKYKGAYFKFGCSTEPVVIDEIRTFEKGEEKEINDWVTNTNASVQNDGESYNLDMSGYSSLRFKKLANLEKGLTFSIDEAGVRSQFGIAFAMLGTGASLDIPPAISEMDIYYNFTDNGDGTVTILSSDGDSATINLNIKEKHTYSLKKIVADGEDNYTLAIDDKPVFTSGIDFAKYIMLNNGSMGAFPTIFTKSAIKIGGLSGQFTTPKVSTGEEENLWDDEWDDGGFIGGWEDDSYDEWEDDWGEEWEDDSYEEWDDSEVEEENAEQVKKYKKVLRRVKIEHDPIIIEYSIWWVWVIVAVVVVAAGTVTFIIVRKKKISKSKI